MLDYPVPPPGPPGPFGTMAWLRATVSRFAEGETHARRRALIEARLATLDPAELRAAAQAAAEAGGRVTPRGDGEARSRGGEVQRGGAEQSSGEAQSGGAEQSGSAATGGDAPVEYVPVAVLAAATGVDGDVVDDVRIVAAAYQPGTDAAGADDALARLIERLPPGGEEVVAQHVALLVQACEATAALIRGDDPPVPTTKRLDPDGNVVAVSLEGRPFGEGRRACPGKQHALALAQGVRDVR